MRRRSFPTLDGMANIAMCVALLALAVLIGHAWWLRRPIRLYGGCFNHSEGPFRYHFYYGFAFLLVVVGLASSISFAFAP